MMRQFALIFLLCALSVGCGENDAETTSNQSESSTEQPLVIDYSQVDTQTADIHKLLMAENYLSPSIIPTAIVQIKEFQLHSNMRLLWVQLEKKEKIANMLFTSDKPDHIVALYEIETALAEEMRFWGMLDEQTYAFFREDRDAQTAQYFFYMKNYSSWLETEKVPITAQAVPNSIGFDERNFQIKSKSGVETKSFTVLH